MKILRKHLFLLVLFLPLFVAPVSASLFGSVGRALGIEGDVGKALDSADSFMPGGGGAIDKILGAPANAAFGGAINTWSDANDKTIDRLGTTNDRTVAKLIQGLEGVQAAISADVDSINFAITTAVASLDESLEKNIEKLDNSLTDQTQRLDTVFQKTTSIFFVLGRVMLTVIIFGGFVYAAYKFILSAKDGGALKQQLIGRSRPIAAAVGLCGVALTMTWIVPDPSRIGTIEDRYKKTYQRALRFEDFANAHTSAAQLTVLRPESAEYRAWTLKAAAIRDLLLRPTTLLQEDRILPIYLKLGQVNYYRKDAGLPEDGDVAALYGLTQGIRAKREMEYIAATVSLQHARELLAASPDRSDQVADLKRVADEAASRLLKLAIPVEMLELTEDARGSLVKAYKKAIEQGAPHSSNTISAATGSPSSVRELGDTLQQKLALRELYRNLTAKYFAFLEAHLRAKSPGASAETASDAATAYCILQRYYKDWYDENYRVYGASTSFVSGLLSGPFVLLSRAQTLQGGGNACNAPLNEQAIKTQVDVVTQWVVPLTTVKLPSTSKSATLLKNTAQALQNRQNESYSEFEKAFLALKDSSPADKPKAVIRVAEMAAVLGLYAESNGTQIPAVHYLRLNHGAGTVENEWTGATRAFLENRLGA